MIKIRAAQLAVFSQERRSQAAQQLLAHARASLPQQTASYGDAQLLLHIEQLMLDAAAFGLQGERDCARMLNLALLYGWDFTRRADSAWMVRMLDDPRVSSVSTRLDLLVEECLHRRASRRKRAQLEIELGIADDDQHDDDIRLEPINSTQSF